MKLFNQSKNVYISKDLKRAVSFSDQLFGLLKKTNPRSLMFKTRFGIHTFGLKNPIDLLILDNNLKVVKLKTFLRPNRLFFWNPKYSTVLELSRGAINKTGTQRGDMLSVLE